MNTTTITESIGDAELVSLSLRGDREAFGAIIARYQSLICALTFSSCGDRGRSEDLAQETFINAWKSLGELQEPARLKSWLCGIARNLTQNALRRAQRTPTAWAEPLAPDTAGGTEDPLTEVASREEEALVWQTLEAMAPEYREPLVLFYREGQSTRAVAEALDLSEDAVAQRLSRGRAMLRENVARTVEGALVKGMPGKAFTAAVLATLPFAATSAKAASVGTMLAQGGTAAKGAALFGGLGGFMTMLGGMFVTLQAHVNEAKSPRERRLLLQNIALQVLGTAVAGLGYYVLAKQHWFEGFPARMIFNSAAIFVGAALGSMLVLYISRRRREIQLSDGTYVEAEWTQPREVTDRSSDGKSTGLYRQGARYLAFIFAWIVVTAAEAPWRQAPAVGIGALVCFAFYSLWFFRRWKNRPRYEVLQTRRFYYWLAIVPGLGTLFLFNKQWWGHRPLLASPHLAIAFNVVVVVAYTALYAFLTWWEKREIRPAA